MSFHVNIIITVATCMHVLYSSFWSWNSYSSEETTNNCKVRSIHVGSNRVGDQLLMTFHANIIMNPTLNVPTKSDNDV